MSAVNSISVTFSLFSAESVCCVLSFSRGIGELVEEPFDEAVKFGGPDIEKIPSK